MSNEMCRECNGKQLSRRRGGQSVQLPDWLMILHSSSRNLRTYTYVNIFGENKEAKKNVGQVSGWACRTCVQNFRVYLLRTAWTFGLLCGKKCVLYIVACNYSIFVWDRVLPYVPLNIWNRQVRSSHVCVKRFTDRRALEYCSRLVQKNGEKMFSYGNAWPFLPFWWSVVDGDTFSPLAPILGFLLLVEENMIPKCVTFE